MKIRNGFVSNSSSSSFCIYKKLMTAEQIEMFRKLIENEDFDGCEETCICEVGDYFIGDLSMHDSRLIAWLDKTFKNGEYVTLS